MSYLHVPDVSEYQADVDWSKVVKHNGGAAIIRAFNGHRVDHAWYGGERRADAHKNGVRVLGIYAYLVASRDWHAQAREFVSIVGKLQPGEFVVLDVEEHVSPSTVEGWLAYVDVHLTYPGYHRAWLYCNLDYARHSLAGIFKSSRNTWLAAYQAHRPQSPKHVLWQHSSAESWPGVGACDCSMFFGDVAGLEAKVWTRPDKTPHPAAPKPRATNHSPHPGAHGPVHRPAAPHPAQAPALAPHPAPAITINTVAATDDDNTPDAPDAPAGKKGIDWGQVATECKHALILGLTSFFGSTAIQPSGGHWDRNALLGAALAAVRLSLGSMSK